MLNGMLNVGGADRALRVVVGVAVLSLVFVGPKTMWGLIGLIPLLTGLIGFCPVYMPLGINTRGENSEVKQEGNEG